MSASMRPGSPAGVCDCGEPLEWREREPGYPMAEHVARGGRERHEAWIEDRVWRAWRRELLLILLALAIALFLATVLPGCTATARRQAGADAVEGAVAYLQSPAGEARVDAVGDRIGQAAGLGAARAVRQEADSVPWWQWVGFGLLAIAPVAGAAWSVRAVGSLMRRELEARGLREIHGPAPGHAPGSGPI